MAVVAAAATEEVATWVVVAVAVARLADATPGLAIPGTAAVEAAGTSPDSARWGVVALVEVGATAPGARPSDRPPWDA